MLTPRQRFGALTKRPDHSEKNPAPTRLRDGLSATACAVPGKSPFYDVILIWKQLLPLIGDDISETKILPEIDAC